MLIYDRIKYIRLKSIRQLFSNCKKYMKFLVLFLSIPIRKLVIESMSEVIREHYLTTLK